MDRISRVATEEAWAPGYLLERYKKLLEADELPISEADRKKLYQTNAEKVFSI